MYRYGIIGDDLRMRYLYEALLCDGFSARLGGEDAADMIIQDCNIIVLPVNKTALVSKCRGKTVIGGFTQPYTLPEGATVKNYLDDSPYTVKNAQCTAEGAIYIAMQCVSTVLAGRHTLITGFGNIGKALCAKLISLGCKVTVCARSATARAEAEGMGAKTCDFSALALYPADIVFNTVPAPVICEPYLMQLGDDAVVIELASLPGGIDMTAARMLGVTVISAQGLPGRYCPRTAGQILKDTVIRLSEGV